MNGRIIDSLHFYLDGKKVSSENNSAFSIQDQVLGIHSLRAICFMKAFKNTKQQHLFFGRHSSIYLHLRNYQYVLLMTANAFTQGLEYKDGFLYESTGQRGASSIRKTALKQEKFYKLKELD